MGNLQARGLSFVALALRGEAPLFDVAIVSIERGLDHPEHVRVAPQKFRPEAWIEPEHVLVDKNLPADAGAGANADGGDF